MRYTCPHCRREFDVLEGSPQPAQCPLCGKALPPQAAHKPRTSRLAIASLILGIVAFASFPFMALLLLEFAPRGPQNVLAFVVVFFLVVPPISALLAVVFGVSVRRRPRRAGARLKGSWLKNTGEFLGVVSLTIWFVTAIVFLPGSWPRPSTELAQRVQSAANLTEIGIGLAVHATAYRGRYPPNLEALVEMDYITAEILKNPRPREHDPDGGYAYVAGLKRSVAGDFVIAYEKTEGLRNSDGLNVLFVNGLVDWMELEEFHAALDKTMKWLAEHNTSPPED